MAFTARSQYYLRGEDIKDEKNQSLQNAKVMLIGPGTFIIPALMEALELLPTLYGIRLR